MSNFNARIKLKRDTAVNWTVNNPVLLNGEIILIDTDSGELRAKVGDGTKTYTSLPFTDEILRNLITNKQDKITGTQGQVVGFDSQGKPVAQEAPSSLPEGGTDGKILGYGSSGPQWIDAPKTSSFVIQSSAPSDTSVLWINSTEHTLNYWDGSAWVKTVGVWG